MMQTDMKIYSVIQKLEWACPGMLIAVDEETEEIIWVQQNPNNQLTRMYADDYGFEGEKFDPSNYKSVTQVNK